MIQQSKIVSHQIMPVFIKNMLSFGHNAEYESRKWDPDAEMLERRFSLNVERHLSLVHSSSFDQDVLDDNAFKNTSRKRKLRNKGHEIFA